MIELRWLERQEDYYLDGIPVAKAKLEKVLQYRNHVWKCQTLMPEDIERGLTSYPIAEWSDWQDVPTVRGGVDGLATD